jgi:phosphoribosylformimino-5-aminoimidazole carboxamide ribonucleotide (ProFAR) isomerase
MLIPSIDLKNGAVVQLVQGERLAIRDDDVFRWVNRFKRFPDQPSNVAAIEDDLVSGPALNVTKTPI